MYNEHVLNALQDSYVKLHFSVIHNSITYSYLGVIDASLTCVLRVTGNSSTCICVTGNSYSSQGVGIRKLNTGAREVLYSPLTCHGKL